MMPTANVRTELPCKKPGTVSMPEAEVTLRVAFWLLQHAGAPARAEIAIDGAHVRISAHQQGGKDIPERIVFDIGSFLREHEWTQAETTEGWRGVYKKGSQTLRIQSVSGFDVQVSFGTKTTKVECKGGALVPRGTGAAAIIASAIGQAITSSAGEEGEELWIAVPDSPAYENVGGRLASNRVFQGTRIHIALVGRSGVRTLT